MNKSTLIFLFCALFAYNEVLAGGGGSSNSGGKNSPQNDECDAGDNGKWGSRRCKDICNNLKDVNIFIYEFFERPKGRISGGKGVCPAPINPWMGNAGVNSKKTNPIGSYYCLITVTSGSCPNFSSSKVWNVGSTKMTLAVPSQVDYKVRVDYYEALNDHWDDGKFYRGMWSSEYPIVDDSNGIIIANYFKYKEKLTLEECFK